MGKRRQKQPVRLKNDPSGCMWGLISIFDFRRGRTTHKLLLDWKRGSKHASGAVNPRNKHEKLTDVNGNSRRILDGETNRKLAVKAIKPSVKELIEEAMFDDQDNGGVLEKKEIALEIDSKKKTSPKKTKRSRTKSDIDINDLDSIDIDNIVQKLCHQINLMGSLDSDLKEKFIEAIQFLITQKLINEKNVTENEEVQLPEDLMNAIEFLCSDEELFLNLMQDPRAIMTKYCQNLQNSQQPITTIQPEELVYHKHRRFFRRKVKSIESPQSNPIVILKPAPGLRNSATESGLSPNSHSNVRNNKSPSDRIGSHFFITEIRRKFKHAMGKDRPEIYDDEVLKQISYEHSPLNGKGTKENVGMRSPSKEHFFTERMTRFKKGDKSSKLKQCESPMENQDASFSKLSESNIYVEAKRHLSEILNNGDEDFVSSSSRPIPKTLGKILSLSQYNLSPLTSPGKEDLENGGTHLETQSSISGAIADTKVEPSNSNAEDNVSLVIDETTCEGSDESLKMDDVDVVVKEEMNALSTHSEPNISSNYTGDTAFDENSEIRNEETDSESLKQNLYENSDQASSPPSVSPSKPSITRMIKDPELAFDLLEHPSPVSVLEPPFIEDDLSPASIKSESELPIQPLRIQFEEWDASSAEVAHIEPCVEDKEPIINYIEAILQASDMKWDEIYIMSHSSEQLLASSLFHEIDLFSNQLCCDKKLLFDCINEVLEDIYQQYFGCSPWSWFVKLSIKPVCDMKYTTLEIWDRVNWHLLPLPLPHSLDQIVRKDMAKTPTWMNLRLDTESVVLEIGEVIFEELMNDVVLDCINGSSESKTTFLLCDKTENENDAI